MESEAKLHNIHFPILQLAFMALTLVFFAFFLYKPSQEFRPKDFVPTLLPISPEIIKNRIDEKKVIDTHFYVYDAPYFTYKRNTFTLRGYLIFTYDPQIVPPEMVKSFEIQRGELKKNKPTMVNHANGTVSEHYIIDVTFSMEINYADYPLDDHTLSFVLINTQAIPDKVLYICSENDFVVESRYAMSRWRDIGHRVKTGFLYKKFPHGFVEYPAISFSIDYAHDAMRQTTIILWPLLVVFFLSIFSLSLNRKKFEVILSIIIASISAIIAHRYVIEGIAPKVGYFMLSDYLFFIFFTAICINFIISMFLEAITIRQLRSIIIGQYACVILLCAYFFLFWI